MKKLALLGITLLAVACHQGQNNSNNALEQKSEVENVVADELSKRPIYQLLQEELDSTEIYDGSIIYGYWFKPHEACAVNVFFHKDNTFEFRYYEVPNDTTIVDVVKRGTFSVLGNKITMVADDGWKKDIFDGYMYHKHNNVIC